VVLLFYFATSTFIISAILSVRCVKYQYIIRARGGKVAQEINNNSEALRLSANPAALPPHDAVRAPWGQATAPAARVLDYCASACALGCCAAACALGFASTATAFVDMIASGTINPRSV
jgi:hypothetical protein